MAVRTFDEFLERLKDLKAKYASSQLKLNAQGLYTILMSGAMDSLFEKPPTIEERHELMKRIQAALKSKTEPAAGKKGELGLADLRSELDRHVWLAQRNPFYSFRFSDQYGHAMQVLGYLPTGAPNLAFRAMNTDVFSNWGALTSPRAVNYYTNPNVKKSVAIVAQYQGFETKQYSRGAFLKIRMFDGGQFFDAAIWPEYGKKTFPPKLVSFIKSQRKKVAVFTGKLTSSKGFVNLTIRDITELE